MKLTVEEIEALCKLEGIHIENGAPDAEETLGGSKQPVNPDGRVWLWRNGRVVGSAHPTYLNMVYRKQLPKAWENYCYRLGNGLVVS